MTDGDAAPMKDPELMELVRKLDLPARGWVAVDHWEADLRAIGIARADDPRRLAYVATHDQPAGQYHVVLETPSGPHPTDFHQRVACEGCGFAEVVSSVTDHLDGREDPPDPRASALSYFSRLADRWPVIAAALKDHLAFHDELLPDLLIGDLYHLCLDELRTSPEATPPIVTDVLDQLSDALVQGDSHLGNAIAVSFVEYLMVPGEEERRLRGLLPPPLRAELEAMEAWRA